MLLIEVVFIIIAVGVLLWLANRYAPMEATTKSIMNGVVIVALVLWLLWVFMPGTMHHLSSIRVGK